MNEIATIRQFFDFLNKNCDYLVLRNWDDIFDEGIYGNGHEDIDILCRDLDSFVHLTKAKRVHRSNYRDNFIVNIGNMNVRFDVRHVGDGYYSAKWEKSMLDNRVLNEQNIYIMNAEDYVYSLSYHAVIQKPKLSKEYATKIINAFSFLPKCEIDVCEANIPKLLLEFCKRKEYLVEIPSDPGVYLNESNLSGFGRSVNIIRWGRRLNLRVVQSISYCGSVMKRKLLSFFSHFEK